MTGQVEFKIELISSRESGVMKLKSRDDYNRHTIFTGGMMCVCKCIFLLHVVLIVQLDMQ